MLVDHDLERVVLSVLADESGLDVNATRLALDQARLRPTDLHLPLHQRVLEAEGELLRNGLPVDMVALTRRLPDVAPGALAQLLSQTPAGLHAFAGYAATLKALSVRRRAIAAADAVRAASGNLDVPLEEVLTAGAKSWASLTQDGVAVRTGSEHLLDLMDDLDAAQNGRAAPCLPTGIDLWDQALGGVMQGELCFIGSQPGVGKSSLLAAMLDNWARAGVTAGLFSLEDLGRWLPRRLIARDAGVPLFVLAKRPLTREQMKRVAEVSNDVHQRLQHVLIDERSMLTADAIVETARDMILNRGARVIVVDHLGKIDHQAQRHDRHDLAYESTLNKLTALAKDHRVPVVIAAHLKGRDADAKFKQPEPTDFAQTAFIERDARTAVGLFLDKQDPDALLVSVLKHTNGGNTDSILTLRRLKEAGLVLSRNGQVQGLSYLADEARLMELRGEAA